MLSSLQYVDLFGARRDETADRLVVTVQRIIGEYLSLDADSMRPTSGSEPIEAKVLLSPEAANDLRNLSPKDMTEISLELERIARGASATKALKVPDATAPHLITRSGSYRIIFRHTDAAPGDHSKAEDSEILVVRIILRSSDGGLDGAISRLPSR